MKRKKLNARGFSHDLVLVAFVAIFAISGVAYLVASHADSCTSTVSGPLSGVQVVSSTSTVSGVVSSPSCPQNGQLTIRAVNITTGGTFAPINVRISKLSGNKKNTCLNPNKNGTYSTAKTLTCPPGKYRISYSGKVKAAHGNPGYRLSGQTTVTLKSGLAKTATLKLKHLAH